ncbi:MAG TPA: NAD(P)H-dependent oxidoreductase [Holophaga sp.]|nr:NAD(P)H-dependent oxidoreductase [Holophaga sp.]
MRTLIVHAHEEAQSFNGAMRDLAVRTLQGQGHGVEVSDLYAMNFKAVADARDFLERRDPTYLKRQLEEKAALELGTLAHDILEEQRKLREADLLILQFPLWWFSMPAILKGWVDRVMTMGFAYGGGKWYDEGGLKGRRAMLALTTGGPEASYAEHGINGAMDAVLFPIQHGILFFCGYQVLPPFVAWGPAHLGPAEREAVLERYRQRLLGLDALEPIPFHPLAHYGEGMQLRPEHR